MAFDKELVSLLACPKCKRAVQLRADESGFACEACRLLYPIEDGIPNFLIDEARPIDGEGAAGGVLPR
ncbi:MAG: Trm112 family protein [Haliangium ochraceum]